jgi:hypothetical protein
MGFFLHVTGCFDGRRGDGYILRRSGLINFLRENDVFNGFFVLGDSAYPNNDVMLCVPLEHVLSGVMPKLYDTGHSLILKNK